MWGVNWPMMKLSLQGMTPLYFRASTMSLGAAWLFAYVALRGARQSPAHFAAQRAATPLGRGSDPEEIAAALAFLLDSQGLTGQLICLDGGQHLAWQTPDVLGVE